MNAPQRSWLATGCAALALAALYPPWQISRTLPDLNSSRAIHLALDRPEPRFEVVWASATYKPLWNPPAEFGLQHPRIDAPRAILTLLAIACATSAAIALCASKNKNHNER